ncbi:hypothetical protein I308_101586 [Cryptococcus tetragattii IND107]|uniref:Zn(2)-C6 fungal-type domain-containing protein n=1 Tax=Cryptococcus tetragattii IND107 TaxID=1296105 RepID=A0ABR3C1I7_9TREE|nr:hypothetical protein I308_04095 [Cryptococcus tetragattii IND107]
MDYYTGDPRPPRFSYPPQPPSPQSHNQRYSPEKRSAYDNSDYHRRSEYDDHSSKASQKRPAEAESSSSQQAAARGHPKARTESPSSSTKPNMKKEAGGSDQQAPRRAAQACLRCRKQKLKCIGGWPCNRCTKSKNVCDFGRPGMGPPAREGGTSEANARLEQLESSVANLLAGLAGSSSNNYPNSEVLHTFDPAQRRAQSISEQGNPPYAPSASGQWNSSIPPPTHIRPLEPPRVGAAAVAIGAPLASASPDDLAAQHHVRFTSSPHQTFIQHGYSPSNFSSNGTGPSPGSGIGSYDSNGFRSERKKVGGKRQKAEERLATATDQDFDEAPFKPLVYQPSVWDNREASRRNSPQPSQSTASRDEPGPGYYARRFMRDRDDPVNTEIVEPRMAETLFNFFIDRCHPFLPVVNVALDDAFNTIRQSPFLTSAILAVAARFYIRYTSRNPDSFPLLDPAVPPRLANLAEAHLANTLLRKQHALSDVQAVMLLAAWGLQSGGRGPDAWVVTGHAARIARRLGVHKILAQAAEAARITRPETEEWSKLEAFMPQWRTWLCWFCFDGFLSLGFGRPQSTQFETVDEQGFLQIRLNQTPPRPGTTPSMSLYGDVYIAGQVQLTQIGRDLINWGEMLADPKGATWADPRRAQIFHGKELSVKMMFKELNGRLDEWCKLWIWNVGSPYSLYLGSSARIARLQADHMRLCLNSFALKSSPDEDEFVAECLKKALNAAMTTIQTHYESSQTDLALSFATDYLTITLAQAAIFLVRIAQAESSVQAILKIEPSVIAHYLKMSVDLLQTGELSETRLSTYLAKTIRDIARAAGINGLGPRESAEDSGWESRPQSAQGSGASATGVAASGSGQATGASGDGADNAPPPDLAFDMDAFLQFESQLDLGYLLGLPGDSGAFPATTGAGQDGQNLNGVDNGAGAQGVQGVLDAAGEVFNEFGFGMAGMAMGYGGLPSLPPPAPTTASVSGGSQQQHLASGGGWNMNGRAMSQEQETGT